MGMVAARRRSHAALDEAVVWEEGARAEFDALLDLVREHAGAAGLDEMVMARLAVVGAAVMKSLGARRAAAGAGARRARRRTRRSR